MSLIVMERGRRAVEDVLIEWRDLRLSTLNAGNGLVVREKDGSPSDIIRLGTAEGLQIGIQAMLDEAELTELIDAAPDAATAARAVVTHLTGTDKKES